MCSETLISGSGSVPMYVAQADRRYERELACYPARDLGLRQINHTRFRGTEFCAADQFAQSFTWMMNGILQYPMNFISIYLLQAAHFDVTSKDPASIAAAYSQAG